jgi:hypothetical protein
MTPNFTVLLKVPAVELEEVAELSVPACGENMRVSASHALVLRWGNPPG